MKNQTIAVGNSLSEVMRVSHRMKGIVEDSLGRKIKLRLKQNDSNNPLYCVFYRNE